MSRIIISLIIFVDRFELAALRKNGVVYTSQFASCCRVRFHGENLPFQISDSTKVCSAHFQPSDFRKTLTGKRVLNKGAVPSIFQWTKPSPKSHRKTRSIQRRLVKAAATGKLNVFE